jgi:hypothetical protein
MVARPGGELIEVAAHPALRLRQAVKPRQAADQRVDADPLSEQGDDCAVLKIGHEPILMSELPADGPHFSPKWAKRRASVPGRMGQRDRVSGRKSVPESVQRESERTRIS